MTQNKPVNFAARLPLPKAGSINSGLTYGRPETGLAIFGQPATPLPENCGTPTNLKLKRALVIDDVGPFRVTGLKPAVESLKRIFAKVKAEKPELYAATGTAGMLCVRYIRGQPGTPSNHAFGTAIDLTMKDLQGRVQIVPLAEAYVLLGVQQLYPYFHAEGWFWGASWDRPDSMHFEVSDEQLRRWHAQGLI